MTPDKPALKAEYRKSSEFLFHLVPTDGHLMASLEAHFCEEDVYSAQAIWDQYSIHLTWRVIGPKKNDEMEYYYS